MLDLLTDPQGRTSLMTAIQSLQSTSTHTFSPLTFEAE